MSAIITNNFRRNSCEGFINQIKSDPNSYFIGIGKSDKWPDSVTYSEDDQQFLVPLPNGTIIEDQDVLDNLITLVKIKEQSVLTPRNRWESGRTYKVYDPYDPLTFDLEGSDYPCYVTMNNNIYACLGNNGGLKSTINPSELYDTFDTTNHVLVTGDGYIWCFIQTNNQSSTFNTEQFIPVNQSLVETNSDTLLVNAKQATGGLIYNYKIPLSAGGSNLTKEDLIIKLKGVDEYGIAIPTIDLNNNDKFVVDVTGGEIKSIEYAYSEDSPIGAGIMAYPLIGYMKASIEVYENTDGNEVFVDTIRINPLVAPIDGFGAKPRRDIPSYYAGCYTRFSGVVDGDALIDTPIRQVSLIKDIQRNSDSPVGSNEGVEYNAEQALDGVNYIQFNANVLTVGHPVGSIISQGDARVYLDRVDLINDRIFYHTNSNSNVNYVPLQATVEAGEITISDINGDELGVHTQDEIDSIVASEYVHDTGEVLFVDHRKKIVRNVDQTEDVKIVIQF